jgi:hypothetical protein
MAMTKCRECGKDLSDLAFACPHCGAPTGRGYGYGYEYRSVAGIGELPLLHIATGIDPLTGRKRIARGVIAIGDIAMGGVAIGGVGIGIVGLGGLGLGVFALGGMAVGVLLALGGAAVGFVAVGGGALGYYACGGGAFGAHTISATSQDPQAIAFFQKSWPGLAGAMLRRR